MLKLRSGAWLALLAGGVSIAAAATQSDMGPPRWAGNQRRRRRS